MSIFKAKAIIPKTLLLDPRATRRAVENGLTGAALSVKADFGVTVQTWKHKPKFKIEKSAGKRIVSTDSDIYRYVSEGTDVRYAVMTPDFKPKTRPGYIGSSAGAGGVFAFSKFPLPGIEPRDFAITIGKKWNRELPVILQRAIDAEVARQQQKAAAK